MITRIDDDRFLTASVVASRLKLGVGEVYDWLKRHDIPFSEVKQYDDSDISESIKYDNPLPRWKFYEVPPSTDERDLV